MIYIGDVKLPDGRVVHGKVRTSMTERDTGGYDILSIDLEWHDGSELNGPEQHMLIDSDTYLWEYVVDDLLATAVPEYPDE